jgi:hypothetical protein
VWRKKEGVANAIESANPNFAPSQNAASVTVRWFAVGLDSMAEETDTDLVLAVQAAAVAAAGDGNRLPAVGTQFGLGIRMLPALSQLEIVFVIA